MEERNFMETKPLVPLLMSMSMPMMLSMLVQSLYNIIDSIYVSRLGTQALTAVSLAFPLQNIVLSAAVGVGVGISALLARSLGQKDQEQANAAASWGVLLSVIHCVLFIILGVVVTKPFLALFTENPEVLRQACDYTYIVMCLSFGCLMQITMEKIYQGLGAMKTTMALLGTGCVINIILDPILIFGYLGFPAMGVSGAAIATVTGQIAAFFLYVIVYLVKNPGVTIHWRYLKGYSHVIRPIYAVGIPSSLMMTLPSVLVGALNGILAAISEVYVAVLGVYFKLQSFIYLPVSGIVQGMRPLVSYNYGAGKYERVRGFIRYSLVACGVIMLLGTVISLAIPEQVLRLFDADEALLQAGALALRIISLGFLVSAIGVVFSGVFEALGKGTLSLCISLLRQLVITLPLGFFLSGVWQAAGVWVAFPMAELVASIVACVFLKRFHGGVFFPFGTHPSTEQTEE